MTEEMLRKAMALFDTPEKWNAFVELAFTRDDIQYRWFKKLQQKLVSLTNADDKHPEWTCNFWGIWDIEWKLKGFENKYLSLHSWAGLHCRLWIRNVDPEKRKKVYELYDKDIRFAQMSSFFDIEKTFNNFDERLWQASFHFNFFHDFDYNNHEKMESLLSWYAGNNTDNVARQIMEQVDKIRTPEMTDLFRKVDELLNEEDS